MAETTRRRKGKADRLSEALARKGQRVSQAESVVSGAVKGLLTLMDGEWYSTEAGALGEWEDGADGKRHFKPRRGGTRGTPGWPDIGCLMDRPQRYMLTVEVKGTKTPIRHEQWAYALKAARFGQPHLIVRSTEALLTGLRFLGLLPKVMYDRPPYPHDWSVWPENARYLPRTRYLFWQERRLGPEYPLPPLEDVLRLDLPAMPHPEILRRRDDEVVQ